MVARERSLESVFNTKVRIDQKSDGRGRIVIEYYSQEELYGILDLIGTIAA